VRLCFPVSEEGRNLFVCFARGEKRSTEVHRKKKGLCDSGRKGDSTKTGYELRRKRSGSSARGYPPRTARCGRKSFSKTGSMAGKKEKQSVVGGPFPSGGGQPSEGEKRRCCAAERGHSEIPCRGRDRYKARHSPKRTTLCHVLGIETIQRYATKGGD